MKNTKVEQTPDERLAAMIDRATASPSTTEALRRYGVASRLAPAPVYITREPARFSNSSK